MFSEELLRRMTFIRFPEFRRLAEEILFIQNSENFLVDDTNNNPNFMKEKDMNFNLYPFYINWKKIEYNEDKYFGIYVHFGYFGSSIYSILEKLLDKVSFKDMIYALISNIYDLLNNKEKNDEYEKLISDLPNINLIYKLISSKIIMYKEIPLYIIVLKIFFIYFLYKKEKEDKIIELMKNEYTLVSYLTEDEYKEIYNKHFKGKVSSTLKKFIKIIGKKVSLPKEKTKYIKQIKLLYKKIVEEGKGQKLEEK